MAAVGLGWTGLDWTGLDWTRLDCGMLGGIKVERDWARRSWEGVLGGIYMYLMYVCMYVCMYSDMGNSSVVLAM